MKQILQLLVALFLGLIIGILLSDSQSAVEIGLVNMGKIVDESPKAHELNQQLSEMYQLLLAEIQEQRERLSDEELAEVEKAAYAQYLEYREQLESQFQQALDQAIADAAEADNIHIVLDKELVRYGGKDLTNKVIKRLE
ncbi:MAG: hypothetical protein GX208_02675 [Firmicutes bacterium]|nr:hypothetical protein [Bacillota bacterium]